MDRLPSQLPFSKRRLRPRVVISYIFDYVILIACAVAFYILDRIEPYRQRFSLQNISLQYPYAVHERISIAAAVACSGGIPIVIIAVYTLFIDGLFSHHKPVNSSTGKRKLTGPYRWKDRLWEFNCGLLGLVLSQALTFAITQALKVACASFAGLFYLSLWIGGKLHIMDNKGEVWKMFLVMLPNLGATLIAVSRIMDARHHPFDVITGSLLGILIASISYRQYFPSLSEPWKKGRAYPIRSWGTDPDPADARSADYNYKPTESTAALRDPETERMHEHGLSSTADLPPHTEAYPAAPRPYVSNPYARRPHEEAWASSSEEDVTNGYEMQGGYARTQNPALPTYEPGMAYHSQTQPDIRPLHEETTMAPAPGTLPHAY